MGRPGRLDAWAAPRLVLPANPDTSADHRRRVICTTEESRSPLTVTALTAPTAAQLADVAELLTGNTEALRLNRRSFVPVEEHPDDGVAPAESGYPTGCVAVAGTGPPKTGARHDHEED